MDGHPVLVRSPPAGAEPVRLFVHLGDTFYFYDHMTEEVVRNEETMHAAHTSMRRHLEFLRLARTVPCCGVWDDHDFASDDTDSTDISTEIRSLAVDTWKRYWATGSRSRSDGTVVLRITHGLVDIYLLDGRFPPEQGRRHLLRRRHGRGSAPHDRGPVTAPGTGRGLSHRAVEQPAGRRRGVLRPPRLRRRAAPAVRRSRRADGAVDRRTPCCCPATSTSARIFHVRLGNDRMAPEFMSTPLTDNDPTSGARPVEGRAGRQLPLRRG